jgi:hypothetical protein
MTNFKIIFTIVVVAAAVVASVLIQRRGQAALRGNEDLMRKQERRLIELMADNQRLSNDVVQAGERLPAKNENTSSRNSAIELAELRARVETLRQEADQLAKKVAEDRRATGTRFYSTGDFNLLDHNRETAITFAGGPRESGKHNDARALAAALRQYATEHHGEIPQNLDQVAAYLPKPSASDSQPWMNTPLSGTNDFEIVYQGSQNDLINIPLRRVALLRERQPWLTPEGKWSRVYAYADGAAGTVESDDNFQSWEAQHIIPPQQGSR